MLGTSKYLGVLSMVGRSKKTTFSFIKDKIWHKINSWSNKCLYKAGRTVIIKYVLQVIMSYVMSILFLPTTLIDVTKKMMNVLWWGHRGAINNGM